MIVYTKKEKCGIRCEHWIAQLVLSTTGEVVGEGRAGTPDNARYLAIQDTLLKSDNPNHHALAQFHKQTGV
ncbi:MAG TPA: hypothetical protein V6D33_12415 [Cyanophyceae cyanobacterium]